MMVNLHKAWSIKSGLFCLRKKTYMQECRMWKHILKEVNVIPTLPILLQCNISISRFAPNITYLKIKSDVHSLSFLENIVKENYLNSIQIGFGSDHDDAKNNLCHEILKKQEVVFIF